MKLFCNVYPSALNAYFSLNGLLRPSAEPLLQEHNSNS